MRRTLVLAALSFGLPLSAFAGTTVAVAPLTTTSGPEYQWIGPAIADAIALRVHQQHELNGMTLRQVNAALRHDGVRPEQLTSAELAVGLGRNLGANVLVVGTYTGAWPDIELVVKLYDPQAKKLINTHMITGGLDNLFDVEARVAKALAVELGAKEPDVHEGSFGTQNLRAWRLTTLALGILNWQSLSPRAADPKTPLKLPASAVRRARGYLEEATRRDESYGEAWAALGVAQALAGDTAAAWRSLGKATALGSGHHPTAALGASFVRMREGKLQEAERILKNAIGRHPGFLHARGYLGELYIAQQRWKDAQKAFDDYAALVPNQPWVLAQRGYARAKLGDFRGAIADSTLAVDISPDSPYLMLELASRYIDAGKLMGAEDTLRTAIDKHPQNSSAYVRLGYVYLLQGKDDLVIPITEEALTTADFGKRARDRGYAHLNLVRAYGRKGELDRAFEHLTKAKQSGTVSLAELRADPELGGLRKDPRFKKLVP